MARIPAVTHVDLNSPVSTAALAAEARLFAHYGVPYRSHVVALDAPRLRLRVLEIGSGVPVLVVPGGSGDAWQFAPLAAALKGYRLIAVNRPGGGLSDAVDHRDVDMRELAVRVVSTVMEAFDLGRADIIANSMGGLWALWFALARPERVARMVQLGCPALFLGSSAPLFMRLITVPLLTKAVQAGMRPRSVEAALDGLRFQGTRPETIAAMPRPLAEATYRFFNLPTFGPTWFTLISAAATVFGARRAYQFGAEEAGRVSCPVQFLWGERDPFGGLPLAQRAVELMPDARLHAMNAGHLPFLDAPRECADVIAAFLSGDVATSGATRAGAGVTHAS